jgi:hypothetical protein
VNGERNTLQNYEPNYAANFGPPNYVPRVRVEIYFPISTERVYQVSFKWLIRELTQLRGGCTVQESMGGYYLSGSKQLIKDRVAVLYSDFPMNWDQPAERAEVLAYCATVKQVLLEDLREEDILISAYPVSHVSY